MTGVVVWFTGLPASGKTTLALRVRERVASRAPCVLLDSDEIRDAIGAHMYGAGDRAELYRALGRLATIFACQGLVVLVAATAARREYREAARAAAPRFIEVWVQTPRTDCEARDVKGLYARARAGDAPTLPGVGVPYEPPEHPEVTASGGFDDNAVERIERLIARA